MTKPLLVGVDPGGHHTGVILRQGSDLHAASLVVRDAGQPIAAYLGEVLDTVAGYSRLRVAGATVAAIVAEDVTPPTGFADGERRPIDPAGLLETAKVLGAILTLPGVIVVESGGNGSQPLDLYPALLIGPLEKVGTGKRRHLRSAWDVAGRGELELRTRRS